MKRILLVEDREDDIVLAKRVIVKILGTCEIAVARDGEEAFQLLRDPSCGAFDLIFLDIQLPGIDGFSVLNGIRSDGRLKNQPVIMLTTSSNPEDMARAKLLGAKFYFVKPLGYKEFEKEMAGVLGKFFTVA
jgi:CheY-like chemotaxis protein